MGDALITRRGGGGSGIENMMDYGDLTYVRGWSVGTASTITVTATIPAKGTYLVIVHDTINTNYPYTNLGLIGDCTIVLVKDGAVKAVKSRRLKTSYSGNSVMGYSQDFSYTDISSNAAATISGTTLTITHPWADDDGMYGTTIFELS